MGHWNQWEIADDFEVLYFKHFIYFSRVNLIKKTDSGPWLPVDPTLVIFKLVNPWEVNEMLTSMGYVSCCMQQKTSVDPPPAY